MLIVDAGYAFNSPYPSILRPSRKIDLILSFDFSERDGDKKDPFTDLIEAEKWAKKRGLKFPKIKAKLKTIEEERGQGQYKELYIFEDDGTPTIMHFVMVNSSFRTVGCQICNDFDIFPSYATMRFKYTRPAFNKLHYLVRHNVKINVSMINKCIQTAIYKKQRMIPTTSENDSQ
ncbi:cytosolic phospholipase A2-like [Mytilus trossulus]|uniref:cytosolic phospholipase A2-like n=1 Tax=Mytilus trossulus TaxID=6551 RepID=UPI003005AA1E